MMRLQFNSQTASPFPAATWRVAACFVAGLYGSGLAQAQAQAQAQSPVQAPAVSVTSAAGPSITVMAAKRGAISEIVMVGGTLVAREEVLVAAQVEGLAITEIHVEEGQFVQKGQILASLSRETVESALAQNSAQIARAEAAIAQTRSAITEAEAAQFAAANSFTRTRQLRDDGIASAETFDQRQSLARQTSARLVSAKEQLRLAEADLALARANRRDYEIRLERTQIKAPTAGLISRRSARLGAIAAGAGDPLFRIIESGAIELEADVAETTLARIRAGQSASVRGAGAASDVAAKVRLVSSEISRTTRLGRVRLSLADPAGLTVGAFARGQIEVARSEGLLMPLSAVQFNADGARVQVVKDGVVETRSVKTGLRQNGTIEIREGLTEGESVVLVAGTFLRNGDRVKPVAVTN
jgi:HlyD family secretion protein